MKAVTVMAAGSNDCLARARLTVRRGMAVPPRQTRTIRVHLRHRLLICVETFLLALPPAARPVRGVAHMRGGRQQRPTGAQPVSPQTK
jgi:hypothetical protein